MAAAAKLVKETCVSVVSGNQAQTQAVQRLGRRTALAIIKCASGAVGHCNHKGHQ